MSESKRECHHPVCILAHELVNNLSVIVGYCDLSQDASQSEHQRDKYLAQIRETAKSMATKLLRHQCQLAIQAGTISAQTETSSNP